MKLDPDVNMTNQVGANYVGKIKYAYTKLKHSLYSVQDALFLISKATELFVESLTLEAASCTKKKTLQKNDVDSAIEKTDILAFLDGAMDD